MSSSKADAEDQDGLIAVERDSSKADVEDHDDRLKRIERDISQVHTRIDNLEKEKQELNGKNGKSAADEKRLTFLYSQLDTLEKRLAGLEARRDRLEAQALLPPQAQAFGGQSQPETRKVTFESKITAKCSNGTSIPIKGVSACENFEDFTNYIKQHLREYLDPIDYPGEFKLYWLFKGQRMRLKVDESNWIEGVEDAQNVSCMLYIYLEPHSSSPPKELTMANLKQHKYSSIPQYQGPTDDSDTSSKNSRDSLQQKVMNSEVTMRDGNKCVICEDATSLFACHILELRDVKSLDGRELLELKLRLNISSMYGVNNGFTLCNLCHTMYDSCILLIRVDESGRYIVECDPACKSDPLFSYKDHVTSIENKALRIPEPKFQKAWPPKEVVQWRYEDNKKKANERKTNFDLMDFECTRCGEVFSAIKQLTNHLKRSKRKCSELRESRKPGKYGGFAKVKMFNQERYRKCKLIVKDHFRKRSPSVNSSFASTFSQMSMNNST